MRTRLARRGIKGAEVDRLHAADGRGGGGLRILRVATLLQVEKEESETARDGEKERDQIERDRETVCGHQGREE